MRRLEVETGDGALALLFIVIFPANAGKFPVLANIFPVTMRRELCGKWPHHKHLLAGLMLSQRPDLA
jgi:hypothetical protein